MAFQWTIGSPHGAHAGSKLVKLVGRSVTFTATSVGEHTVKLRVVHADGSTNATGAAAVSTLESTVRSK
jgi:hypothetical protein